MGQGCLAVSWQCYLGDTMTGLIDRPIDLPSFSWSVDIGDSSLSTNKDKGAGTDEWSGITVPWTAIGESDPSARSSALSTMRRCLTMFWDDGDGGIGVPVLWGAIGDRTDTWLDTSFQLYSMASLLSSRYLCREGEYGSGSGGTSPGTIRYEGLSYRGIMCALASLCTSEKPGGSLPIDLPYLNESGTRAREYSEYDIQNNSCMQLIENLCNVISGPDVQLRPYMSDGSHVRVSMLAGSDGDIYLGQSTVHTLTCFPGGGTLQNISVDHAGPVMRVYSSGSGTDAAQICYMSEDLSLCSQSDPWPLVETTYSDSDTDSLSVLKNHADAQLESNCRPLMQLSGYVDFNDDDVPSPGSMWPGEVVDVAIDDFPTIPSGVYRMRLMQMSGDQSSRAKLKFDVMDDPVY